MATNPLYLAELQISHTELRDNDSLFSPSSKGFTKCKEASGYVLDILPSMCGLAKSMSKYVTLAKMFIEYFSMPFIDILNDSSYILNSCSSKLYYFISYYAIYKKPLPTFLFNMLSDPSLFLLILKKGFIVDQEPFIEACQKLTLNNRTFLKIMYTLSSNPYYESLFIKFILLSSIKPHLGYFKSTLTMRKNISINSSDFKTLCKHNPDLALFFLKHFCSSDLHNFFIQNIVEFQKANLENLFSFMQWMLIQNTKFFYDIFLTFKIESFDNFKEIILKKDYKLFQLSCLYLCEKFSDQTLGSTELTTNLEFIKCLIQSRNFDFLKLLISKKLGSIEIIDYAINFTSKKSKISRYETEDESEIIFLLNCALLPILTNAITSDVTLKKQAVSNYFFYLNKIHDGKSLFLHAITRFDQTSTDLSIEKINLSNSKLIRYFRITSSDQCRIFDLANRTNIFPITLDLAPAELYKFLKYSKDHFLNELIFKLKNVHPFSKIVQYILIDLANYIKSFNNANQSKFAIEFDVGLLQFSKFAPLLAESDDFTSLICKYPFDKYKKLLSYIAPFSFKNYNGFYLLSSLDYKIPDNSIPYSIAFLFVFIRIIEFDIYTDLDFLQKKMTRDVALKFCFSHIVEKLFSKLLFYPNCNFSVFTMLIDIVNFNDDIFDFNLNPKIITTDLVQKVILLLDSQKFTNFLLNSSQNLYLKVISFTYNNHMTEVTFSDFLHCLEEYHFNLSDYFYNLFARSLSFESLYSQNHTFNKISIIDKLIHTLKIIKKNQKVSRNHDYFLQNKKLFTIFAINFISFSDQRKSIYEFLFDNLFIEIDKADITFIVDHLSKCIIPKDFEYLTSISTRSNLSAESKIILLSLISRVIDDKDKALYLLDNTLLPLLFSSKTQPEFASQFFSSIRKIYKITNSKPASLIQSACSRISSDYSFDSTSKNIILLTAFFHPYEYYILLNMVEETKSTLAKLLLFDVLSKNFMKQFEPFSIEAFSFCLKLISDSKPEIKTKASECLNSIILHSLSHLGLTSILRIIFDELADESPESFTSLIKTKITAIKCLPIIFNKFGFSAVLRNHFNKISNLLFRILVKSSIPELTSSTTSALGIISHNISCPEVKEISHKLVRTLFAFESENVTDIVNFLYNSGFKHFIDSASLAIIIPFLKNCFKTSSLDMMLIQKLSIFILSMVDFLIDITSNLESITDLFIFISTLVTEVNSYANRLYLCRAAAFIFRKIDSRCLSSTEFASFYFAYSNPDFSSIAASLFKERFEKLLRCQFINISLSQLIAELIVSRGIDFLHAFFNTYPPNFNCINIIPIYFFISLCIESYEGLCYKVYKEAVFDGLISFLISSISNNNYSDSLWKEYVQKWLHIILLRHFSFFPLDSIILEIINALESSICSNNLVALKSLDELILFNFEKDSVIQIFNELSKRTLNKLIAYLFLFRHDDVELNGQTKFLAVKVWRLLVNHTPKALNDALFEIIESLIFNYNSIPDAVIASTSDCISKLDFKFLSQFVNISLANINNSSSISIIKYFFDDFMKLPDEHHEKLLRVLLKGFDDPSIKDLSLELVYSFFKNQNVDFTQKFIKLINPVFKIELFKLGFLEILETSDLTPGLLDVCNDAFFSKNFDQIFKCSLNHKDILRPFLERALNEKNIELLVSSPLFLNIFENDLNFIDIMYCILPVLYSAQRPLPETLFSSIFEKSLNDFSRFKIILELIPQSLCLYEKLTNFKFDTNSLSEEETDWLVNNLVLPLISKNSKLSPLSISKLSKISSKSTLLILGAYLRILNTQENFNQFLKSLESLLQKNLQKSIKPFIPQLLYHFKLFFPFDSFSERAKYFDQILAKVLDITPLNIKINFIREMLKLNQDKNNSQILEILNVIQKDGWENEIENINIPPC